MTKLYTNKIRSALSLIQLLGPNTLSLSGCIISYTPTTYLNKLMNVLKMRLQRLRFGAVASLRWHSSDTLSSSSLHKPVLGVLRSKRKENREKLHPLTDSDATTRTSLRLASTLCASLALVDFVFISYSLNGLQARLGNELLLSYTVGCSCISVKQIVYKMISLR